MDREKNREEREREIEWRECGVTNKSGRLNSILNKKKITTRLGVGDTILKRKLRRKS